MLVAHTATEIHETFPTVYVSNVNTKAKNYSEINEP